MFIAEELDTLEPIDEESFQPIVPSIINRICVNMNSKSKKIKEMIDLRRMGPNRQMSYLAKAIDGNYYSTFLALKATINSDNLSGTIVTNLI